MNAHPKRGEIYWVHFPKTKGKGTAAENIEPALVVSNDINNEFARTVTVAPITHRKGRKMYDFQAFVPLEVTRLEPGSMIRLEWITTVGKSRLGERIGTLPEEYLAQAIDALRIHLDI